MKAILAAFQLAMTTLKAKADAALSSVPSVLDQVEGANQVAAAIDTLRWCGKNVEEWLSNVSALEKKFDEELTSGVAAALEAKVAAGEFVPKDKVEAAVAAARTEEQNAAMGRIAEAVAAVKVVNARRASITEKHGAEVAAKLTDEQLAGDDAAFASFSTELDRRVTALCEIGVTATDKPASFQRIACGIAFDADGGKAFDTELESVRELAGNRPGGSTAASQPTPGRLPGSGQPPAAGGGNGGGNRQTAASEDAEAEYGF